MDQRYVETVRACKAIMRNLDYLDDNISYGQRAELNRLLRKVQDSLDQFLLIEDEDEGLWVGEE